MSDTEEPTKQSPATEATGSKQAESTESTESTMPADDLREKFRQALDRKQGKGAAGTGEAGGDATAKASARTSNSKVQREFRRKSGG